MKRYLDWRKASKHPLHIADKFGVQRSLTDRIVGITLPCEHCDGERSPLVRFDELRGRVCPPCDSALDEMFEEGAYTS